MGEQPPASQRRGGDGAAVGEGWKLREASRQSGGDQGNRALEFSELHGPQP